MEESELLDLRWHQNSKLTPITNIRMCQELGEYCLGVLNFVLRKIGYLSSKPGDGCLPWPYLLNRYLTISAAAIQKLSPG
jgi:hypothetical protein